MRSFILRRGSIRPFRSLLGRPHWVTAGFLWLLCLASGGCTQWRMPSSVANLGLNASPPSPSKPTPSVAASPIQGDSADPEASRKLELAIRLETAALARKRGMDDEAIDQYLAARKLDPQVRGVAHPLAVLFDRAGRSDAAEKEYRAALAELPNDADVWCDYGYFLHSRQRYEEAETALRTALKKRPNHSQASINLALVVGTRGNFDESRQLFEQAIGPAGALHNVGMLKLQAGDRAGGVADLRAAAALDPSLEQTREVLSSLAMRSH